MVVLVPSAVLVSMIHWLLALVFSALTPEVAGSLKNVLYIVADDLRPELAAYGLPRRTEHIDSLAKAGTTFLRTYAQQALCGPSRNSFMSGRRPDQTFAWNQKNHFREIGPDWTTLPGMFKKSGYLTVGTGKLYHPCPFAGKFRNTSHLLDCGGPPDYDGLKSWSPEALPYNNPCYGWGLQCYPCPKQANTTMPWCEHEALDDTLTVEHALMHLEAAALHKKPFFLGVGFHKPHLPWQAEKKYFDMYPLQNVTNAKSPHAPAGMPDVAFYDNAGQRSPQEPIDDEIARQSRRAYYATVAEMDAKVGRLLAKLEKLGLSESTAIVFHGDHGWSLGEQNLWGKYTNFENSAHVPLIVKAPWISGSAGRKAETMSELVDIMPTLAELAGIPMPKEAGLDGVSLVPALSDSNFQAKTSSLSQYPRHAPDVKQMWRHNGIDHVPRAEFTHMGYSLRTPEWRYTEWLQWDGANLKANFDRCIGRELYDHRGDKGFPRDFDSFENENLIDKTEYAVIVANLSRELRQKVGAAEASMFV
jgi:iduronate 2-sulfatase